MTDEIQKSLSKVKNKIMVFSGKGGVGKSTVSANLSLAFAQKGLNVGLLDVDIHGPNLAKILGVEGKFLSVDTDKKILPCEVLPNLKLVSMAFLLPDSSTPVIWRGPLKMKAIQQFLGDVKWGELDWLIIDSPPGTGDEPLSVAQLIPDAGAIIVTTPQELALLDSRKAVNFARQLKMKIYGIIENMSGFICPNCGAKINLFKEGGGERASKELGVPFLGKIPFDPRIVECGDDGKPFLISHPDSESAKAFLNIVDKILRA